MPKTSKKDRLKKWKSRISWAKRMQEPKAKLWKTYLEWYEARAETGEEEFTFSTVYSFFSTLIPSLAATPPRISVEPLDGEGLKTADLIEKIVEDIFKKNNLTEEVKNAVMASVIFGIGYAMVGFSRSERLDEKDDDEIFDNFLEQGGETEKEFKAFAGQKENVTTRVIDYEGVWVEQVPPWDLFCDPEATKLESCRWIYRRSLVTVDEFKELFGNIDVPTVTKRAKGSNQTPTWANSIYDDGDFERIELLDIWSKEDGRRMVMVEGHDKFVADEPWPYKTKRYPFASLALIDKYNSIDGLSGVGLAISDTKVFEAMLRKEVDNAVLAKSGTVYEKGALDDPQRDSLTSADNGFVCEVNDINRIVPFQTTPLPPEVFAAKNDAQSRIQRTSRQSNTRLQAEGSRKETATKVQAEEAAANVQTSSMSQHIDEFIGKLATVTMELVKQFYEQPQLVEIDKTFGEPAEFVQWAAEDIGEFNYSVKAGSTAFKQDALQVQQNMQFLQLIAGFKDSPVIPNPTALIRSSVLAIGKSLDIPIEDIEEAFKPPEGQLQGQVAGQAQGQPQGQGAGGVPEARTKLPSETAPNKPAPQGAPPPSANQRAAIGQ